MSRGAGAEGEWGQPAYSPEPLGLLAQKAGKFVQPLVRPRWHRVLAFIVVPGPRAGFAQLRRYRLSFGGAGGDDWCGACDCDGKGVENGDARLELTRRSLQAAHDAMMEVLGCKGIDLRFLS